jgi:hypothetical protein
VRQRDLAGKVNQALEHVTDTLMDLIEVVSAVEDPVNVTKFTHAIGSVLWEIADKVLGPLHNQFPDLRPGTLRETPL